MYYGYEPEEDDNEVTQITARTPLKTIKQLVMQDFEIMISNADAKEIREGARTGTLIWRADQITNVSRSANIQRLTRTGLMTREGAWSRKEWNARERERMTKR